MHLFNKTVGLQACNLIRKRLQHRCFPVNTVKFQKTPILKNIWERLLLYCSLVWYFSNLRIYQKNLENSKATKNSPWWFWERLWYLAKQNWKSENGNKTIKSSGYWRIQNSRNLNKIMYSQQNSMLQYDEMIFWSSTMILSYMVRKD